MTSTIAKQLYLAQHLLEVHGRPVLIFNPKNLPPTELPAIFAFSNVKNGGDGPAYALAEDGTDLGSHWCSNEGYVPHDLGVLEGCREDRHEEYRKHYPNGYRMEFVRSSEVEGHAGLRKAFDLNQKKETSSAEKRGAL